MRQSVPKIVLLVALFLGAAAAVWLLRSREAADEPAPSPAASTATPDAPGGDATTTTAAVAEEPATGAAPQPLILPAVVPQDAAELIEQLSVFGARDVQQRLIVLGRTRAPDMLAALRDITNRQNALPASQRAERERLEKQKLQLYPVIARLAGPEAAPVLIEVALSSPANSFAFDSTSDTLDAIGATEAADRFAADLASRTDASKSMLYAAFERFSHRPPPAQVLEAATRWVGPEQDYRIRNAALRVIASSAPAQVPQAFRALLAVPDTVDFTALSALAETVQPQEFAALTRGSKLDADYLRKATAFNEFRWADSVTRARLAPGMLGSDLPELQAAGLRELLENGRASELPQLGVAAPVGEPRELYVRPDYKVMIARLGYSLSLAGDAIVIGRTGP